MIRVSIELVPHGVEERKRRIGTVEIWNDGTGTNARGNYGARTIKLDGHTGRTATIKNWARLSRPVHELVKRALTELKYK